MRARHDSLLLCILLLIFTLSLFSLSHSVSPSRSYLYLSEVVSLSFLSALLLSVYSPPSFSCCQIFFHSPFELIFLFPDTFYSLAILVSLSPCIYFYLNSNSLFLARTLLGTELQNHMVQLLHYEYNNSKAEGIVSTYLHYIYTANSSTTLLHTTLTFLHFSPI